MNDRNRLFGIIDEASQPVEIPLMPAAATRDYVVAQVVEAVLTDGWVRLADADTERTMEFVYSKFAETVEDDDKWMEYLLVAMFGKNTADGEGDMNTGTVITKTINKLRRRGYDDFDQFYCTRIHGQTVERFHVEGHVWQAGQKYRIALVASPTQYGDVTLQQVNLDDGTQDPFKGIAGTYNRETGR